MADPRSQLESVIQVAIDSALKEVHTCLPAVVTKVNMADQLIDAQVTIKRKLAGELVNLPLLVNVPIRFPRSATFSITFPIEVDDHVLILFSERSIDTWLTQGGIKNPFDFRKFSLSDAFAIPSMYPQTDKIPDFDADNLEIKTNSGNTKIIVKNTEDIEIITTGEVQIQCDEANVLCNDALLDCDTATVNADTSVDVTTPIMTVDGDLDVTGTITAPNMNASTSLIGNSIEMTTHTHPQGNDSAGDTEVDTDGPQ